MFMTCGSFDHCIICLSSIHDLWFIWPLHYLSLFYSWLDGQMNHKSWIEERQIIQWSNELQVINRRKTDNTMVKWTKSHEQKKNKQCNGRLSSIHDLWFIWQLHFLSFFYSWLWFIWPLNYLFSFYSWLVVQRPNEPQVMNRRKTDNTMAKWTTIHE
jgi:hypothetical protein